MKDEDDSAPEAVLAAKDGEAREGVGLDATEKVQRNQGVLVVGHVMW